MTAIFTLPLRIAQGLFALVVLGLTSYGTSSHLHISPTKIRHGALEHFHPAKPKPTTPANLPPTAVANWWSGQWHQFPPSEVNFLIITAAWTLLALAYLVIAPARFPAAAHKSGILAAEALTMLFWFAGFVALAVFLSDRVCFGIVCNVAKAGAAFAAFEWYVPAPSSRVLRGTRGWGVVM